MNMFKSLLRHLHDGYHDYKQEWNRAALAPLGDGDANSAHIASRRALGHEATRLTGVALRRIKEDKQRAQAAIELYLDDWIFHNGPITKENFAQAMSDCIDRIKQRANAAQRVAENRAEDGMKDFPF
jgi:hypothetical protein